jgi:WD40 repeat protein/tetratricopeptide (TPR) repeat protein
MNSTPAKMNPFPGLRPFSQEEDYLFFGREEQTIELLQRLGSNRFVAVVGTSGSGKSSLVRCGLLSELLGGRMLEAGAAWEIAVTHPGGNPLALLTDALLDADLYDREQEHARENLLATLSRSHFGLVEAVKQADLGEGTNFLLVVDQFEEVFRFHEAGLRQQEAANEFVSLLLEAAAQKEVPIYVVLTMRSDFIGECGQFEGLAEMVNRGEFLIPRLTREQYKRVIEGPIKVAGGQIAPRLLQRLLNDLGQQADQLPCLQHALMRTWDVWAAKGDADALDLDDYQRVGRMSQALSLHADEIYASLPGNRQRELCQGIFQALTVEESNSRGIRRPQRLGRLCQILEVPAEELRPIIDAYRQSGVTFLMPSPEVELTDQTIIDISHESLMRVWTRLRQWVEEETQAAGIYHRLSESADLHEQGKAGLYRDPELGIALAWRDAKRPNAAWAERYRPGFAVAMGFLEASRQASVAEEQRREAARQHELAQAQQLAEAQQLRLAHQQRAARKLRGMIGGLAVVAVIAGLACIVALFANGRANRLAENARQNEEKATQNAKRAEESRQETVKVLAVVETQKNEVVSSLTKAQQAEEAAKAAEEAGRKLLYTTDLKLAPFVWRDDRTTAQQLRTLLAKHIPDVRATAERPDLRGFEWHFYQHLLEHSATVFSGHAAAVVGGAFVSDDQLLSLDDDGQVRRWNLASQEEDLASRRDLPGGATAQARALSPDGRQAALVEGNKVHVVDCTTGKETWQTGSASVRSPGLIFSRDGHRLVILDDKIRWCDAATGEIIATVSQRFDTHRSLALSADGLTLAVVGHGDTSNLVSAFRLDTSTKTAAPLAKEAGIGGTLAASALSPDGNLIAVGLSLSGTLYVFDTARGNPIAVHRSAHASPLAAMAFANDGSRLATADDEGIVKIWADARKISSRTSAAVTLKGHQGEVHSVGFSSDGKRLFTTGTDQTARVWETDRTRASIRQLEYSSSPYVARFSPSGRLIALGESGGIGLWDAATGQLVRLLSANNNDRAFSVAFSPTDERLLAVGFGGEADVSHVALWDIDTGTELVRLPGATDLPDFLMGENNGAVGALAFSPDGKYLVAGFGSKNMYQGGSSPSPLKVWDVATRRLIRRLQGHTGYCVSLDFSRDGLQLASASRDGTAILWSTETWKATHTLQNPERDTLYSESARPGMFEDAAFSPDGRTLALASREGTVQLWDVASGQILATLEGHSSAVGAVAFSPDGRTLASGSTDQTVRLWNVETRNELMQLDSGSVELGQVRTLAFSPDGTQLLAGGDRTAIWSTAPPVWSNSGRTVESLQALLQSNADFQSRIRMFSENLRLHAALAKLDSQEVRVRAAQAAAEANWHSSQKEWPAAAAAYDRLVAADPTSPTNWLRMPGLLRLATALLHQNRPRDAALLLTGGAKRRSEDGLVYVVANAASLGLMFSSADGQFQVGRLFPESPAARSALRVGDVIVKVNDTELTSESTMSAVSQLLAGEAGATVRLTVRHPGSNQLELIELKREQFINDVETGELLHPLRAVLNERLAQDPRDPELLELRAELAGQWSDTKAQVADYTAAIEALAERNPEPTADLHRLYLRRGHAYFTLQLWQEAADDYARIVTDETTDEALLANQALAVANSIVNMHAAPTWTVLKPAATTSEMGATLTMQKDGAVLVETKPDVAADAIRWQSGSTPPQALRVETSTNAKAPINGEQFLSEYQIVAASMATEAGALRGRFVRLDLPGDNRQFPRHPSDQEKKYINLAELQVFQGAQNIALSKKARASSGEGRLAPEGAIDGNTVGNDDGNPYAHTWDIENPWWELDLGSEQTIDRMVVWNRSDVPLYPRMNHFRIRVLDRSRRVVFEQVIDQAPNPSREIVRPVLLADTESMPVAETSPPLLVRLPLQKAPFHIRVSAASNLTDLRVGEEIQVANPWQKLATAFLVQENHQAIDQLAERHPKLVGQIGDVFVLGTEKNWSRAVEIYSRGITDETTDADLLAKRARAYEGLQNWDAAAADWSRAATASQDGIQWLAEFAARLATADQAALASAKFDEAQSRYEQSLQADAENDVVASELAQLLLNRHERRIANRWTNLRPIEMSSDKGATLALQSDGSILASGTNADGDIYRISAVGNLDKIAAVRLEAIPDPSLPQQGPGRHESGNFHLRAFRLYHSAGDGAAGLVPLPIGRASASYQWNAANTDIAGTIDESLNKFWHIWGRLGKPHEAVYVLRQPVTGNDRPLVIELRQHHALGRFRLSVIGKLTDLESDERRLAVSKVTDPWRKLAAAYALNDRHARATEYFDKALRQADGYEARKPVLELAAKFDDVVRSLAQRHANDAQVQLTLARTLAERGQMRLKENKAAEAQAELQKSREIYTQLRVTAPQAKWTVPTPTDLQSRGDETLSVENDGSILVSGPNPRRAVYTLKLPIDLPTLTAIRLETILDARLPDGGAGRFGNGNFHLAEFTAAIVPDQGEGPATPVQFSTAIADSPTTGSHVLARSIDGNNKTYWDTHPQVKESHWAVFGLKTPAKLTGNSLIITLDSGITSWGEHGLGRFRLSVTDDPQVLQRERNRTDLKQSEVVDLSIALAEAHAQQSHTQEATASFAEALELTADRASKAKIIARAAPLAGVLEMLATSAASDRPFQVELARHYAEQGNAELADTTRTRARALLEQQMAKEPESLALATELAELLLLDTTAWTVLMPVQMNSRSGVAFTAQQDRSLLVTGNYAAKDLYSVEVHGVPPGIQAIRLEALRDDRLPGGGPGTYGGGQFVLSDFKVFHPDEAATSGWKPIFLRSACATFEERPASQSLEIGESGWSIDGGYGRSQTACFAISQGDVGSTSDRLRFLLDFYHVPADGKGATLGRFRLSASNSPSAFASQQRRFAALKLTDPWAKLAAAYSIVGDQAALDKLLARHRTAAVAVGDLFAAEKNWQQAIAEYSKAIGPETKDAPLLAKRAEANEKLEQWDLAVADWTRASQLQPDVAFQRFKPAGTDSWRFQPQYGGAGSSEVVEGELVLSTTIATGTAWHVKSYQSRLQLENGAEYVIRFQMKSPDACPVTLAGNIDQADFHNIGLTETFIPPAEFQQYEFSFVPRHAVPGNNRIGFNFGTKQGQVIVKEIVILKKSEGADFYTARGIDDAREGRRDEAVAAFTQVLQMGADRATKAKIIAAAAPLAGALEMLAESAASDGQFQAELTLYHAAHGNIESAEAARKRARPLLEASLAREPNNVALATELADLLLFSIGAKTILPTSESEGVAWLATTTQPPDNWMQEDFDASAWKTELGGFGGGAEVPAVRTKWTASDIWLRQTFEWQPSETDQTLALRLVHDDNVEVYLNGQPAASLTGWTWQYIMHPLDAAAARALRAGTNTIAVHCHQNDGGQLIDVGIVAMPYRLGPLRQHSAAMKLQDPWEKLAGAYVIHGDHDALNALLKAHPAAAAAIGDLYAADQNWEQAIGAYSKLIVPVMKDASLLTRRATAYIATEQWEQAKADWKRAVELQPDLLQRAFDDLKAANRWADAAEFGEQLVELKIDDSLEWLRIAPVLVLAGDQAAYTEYCRRMAAQFAESKLPEDADRVIKASLLRAGSIDVAKLPVSPFGQSLDDGTIPEWLAPWAWGTRALVAHRSSDAPSAAKFVAKSEESKPAEFAHAMNLAVLAMADHRLSRPAEARTALDELSQLVARRQASDKSNRDHDLLIAEIMLREADALITDKVAPLSPGAVPQPVPPTDN